jgi:hypothetical protein
MNARRAHAYEEDLLPILLADIAAGTPDTPPTVLA